VGAQAPQSRTAFNAVYRRNELCAYIGINRRKKQSLIYHRTAVFFFYPPGKNVPEELYARIEGLEPIGTALYKHLYYHLSNLYSLKKRKTIVYTKDYADICATWLGGLKVLRFKSKILQEQLGTHLEAIKRTGLIKKFALEKNAAADGFNLTVQPGPAFFEDYELYYTKRLQYEMHFAKELPPQHHDDPMTLVASFYKTLHPAHRELEHMVFMDKETELAATLLEHYSAEEIRDLIVFTVEEARKSRFDIRNFGAVKIYLRIWLEQKEVRARKAREEEDAAARKRDELLQAEYHVFRREAIERLKASLPAETLAAYEEEARAQLIAEGSHPITIDLMGRVRAATRLADEHGIPSYEQSKMSR
jgi:hypothetical protein